MSKAPPAIFGPSSQVYERLRLIGMTGGSLLVVFGLIAGFTFGHTQDMAIPRLGPLLLLLSILVVAPLLLLWICRPRVILDEEGVFVRQWGHATRHILWADLIGVEISAEDKPSICVLKLADDSQVVIERAEISRFDALLVALQENGPVSATLASSEDTHATHSMWGLWLMRGLALFGFLMLPLATVNVLWHLSHHHHHCHTQTPVRQIVNHRTPVVNSIPATQIIVDTFSLHYPVPIVVVQTPTTQTTIIDTNIIQTSVVEEVNNADGIVEDASDFDQVIEDEGFFLHDGLVDPTPAANADYYAEPAPLKDNPVPKFLLEIPDAARLKPAPSSHHVYTATDYAHHTSPKVLSAVIDNVTDEPTAVAEPPKSTTPKCDELNPIPKFLLEVPASAHRVNPPSGHHHHSVTDHARHPVGYTGHEPNKPSCKDSNPHGDPTSTDPNSL